MKCSNTSGRYALLDELRGLDLVSMMLYHGCWDLVNLFGIQANWYYGLPGHLWQQSICWVFILLSGFCVQLGHHTMRRGAQVFGAGALVTAVTLLFMPEDKVVFGVLTLLGSAMLLTGLLVLFYGLFCPSAVAVSVLGGVLSLRRCRAAAHGALAPLGLPAAGLAWAALAAAVSVAPAGHLRGAAGGVPRIGRLKHTLHALLSKAALLHRANIAPMP